MLLLVVVFMSFLPGSAKGRVISEFFSRLFDWMMGPAPKEYVITSQRRRGFLEF
jgi:hypothetical protein